MSTIRINPYQKEFLASLYSKFGEEPFEWSEAEPLINKGMFRVFCDNNFIIKSGVILRKTITNSGRQSYSTVNHWRMNTGYVERFIYGSRKERKRT